MGAFVRRYRDFLLIAVIAAVLGLAVVAGPVVSAFVTWAGEPAQFVGLVPALRPVIDTQSRCPTYSAPIYVAATGQCEGRSPTYCQAIGCMPQGQGPYGPCPKATMWWDPRNGVCSDSADVLCPGGLPVLHYDPKAQNCLLAAQARHPAPPSCPLDGHLVSAADPTADTCMYDKGGFQPDFDWGSGVRVMVGSYVSVVVLVLSARALRRA